MNERPHRDVRASGRISLIGNQTKIGHSADCRNSLGLQLKRTDVARRALGTGNAALVGGHRISVNVRAVGDGVDRDAAGQ